MNLEQFDPNNPQWQIQRYVPAGNEEYWKLVDWEHVGPEAGATWIRVQTFANGAPVTGIKVQHFYPQPPLIDGVEQAKTEMKDSGDGIMQPIAEFDLNPSHSAFDASGHGPHNIRLLDRSDIIYGSGTPVKNYHYQDRFVFERVRGAQPPQPDPDPEPEPNGDYVTRAEFQALCDNLIAALETARSAKGR